MAVGDSELVGEEVCVWETKCKRKFFMLPSHIITFYNFLSIFIFVDLKEHIGYGRF